jgi:hypothetical protein
MADLAPPVEAEGTIQFLATVDTESALGFVQFEWQGQHGAFTIAEARNAALAIVEAAEQADVQAALYRYLLASPEATREGAARIIAGFRRFRVEEGEESVPEEEGQ